MLQTPIDDPSLAFAADTFMTGNEEGDVALNFAGTTVCGEYQKLTNRLLSDVNQLSKMRSKTQTSKIKIHDRTPHVTTTPHITSITHCACIAYNGYLEPPPIP